MFISAKITFTPFNLPRLDARVAYLNSMTAKSIDERPNVFAIKIART